MSLQSSHNVPVEEERKPANPRKELNVADILDFPWQKLHSFVDLDKRCIPRMISPRSIVSDLFAKYARQRDANSKPDSGNDAKSSHLRSSVHFHRIRDRGQI